MGLNLFLRRKKVRLFVHEYLTLSFMKFLSKMLELHVLTNASEQVGP